MPARQCSRVDLPDPDGPITASDSPAARSTSTPARAVVDPKRLTRPRADRRGGAVVMLPGCCGPLLLRVGPRAASGGAGVHPRADAGPPTEGQPPGQTTSATPASTTTPAPAVD